jgi:hypothetical protein
MAISLLLKIDDAKLEAVYTWLEQHKGSQVQLWGLENQRRAALLAYSDGPDDDFGWGNWAVKVGDDPSELLAFFEQLELVVDAAVATTLNATFLGVFTVVENTAFG